VKRPRIREEDEAVAREQAEHRREVLLEREPREAILRSFDLPAISRYFPEYQREIQRRLGS